jgi:Undecaprenyl-phosphate galactose phosphotransferase WbaP
VPVSAAATAELERFAAERAQPAPRVRWRPQAATATALGFLAADLAAWAAATGLVLLLRWALYRDAAYLGLTWSAFLIWFLLRASAGSYQPSPVGPAGELRRAAILTTTAAGVHLAMLLAAGEVSPLRLTALLVWPLLIPIDWIVRGMARRRLMSAGLFGHPTIVLGAGSRLRRVLQEMTENSENGLIPVAAFDADSANWGTVSHGVPILGGFAEALSWSAEYGVRRAVLTGEEEDPGWTVSPEFIQRLAARYPTIGVITDIGGVANLWARPRPLGVFLALEIPHARHNAVHGRMKRAFDLALTVPVMLVAAPIIGVAALLVKIFSPGPAFFTQEREGKGGKVVRVYKIRTMVPNAEQRLAEFLRDDPEARLEWERFLKLRKDPRIIPVVGQAFRRFSIDELPQLWHVLTGEMSLVGPRIFALWHVERFPKEFRELRRQVPPGMTGLWQVAHRNSGDLKIQETVDSYYIHNWSVWMDLWILFRTVRIVLTGKGAY